MFVKIFFFFSFRSFFFFACLFPLGFIAERSKLVGRPKFDCRRERTSVLFFYFSIFSCFFFFFGFFCHAAHASPNLFARTLCNFTSVESPSSREDRALDAVPEQTILCVLRTNNASHTQRVRARPRGLSLLGERYVCETGTGDSGTTGITGAAFFRSVKKKAMFFSPLLSLKLRSSIARGNVIRKSN